ncbi:hypothetical protein V6N13_075871 [Hibiscus sabdariffa]
MVELEIGAAILGSTEGVAEGLDSSNFPPLQQSGKECARHSEESCSKKNVVQIVVGVQGIDSALELLDIDVVGQVTVEDDIHCVVSSVSPAFAEVDHTNVVGHISVGDDIQRDVSSVSPCFFEVDRTSVVGVTFGNEGLLSSNKFETLVNTTVEQDGLTLSPRKATGGVAELLNQLKPKPKGQGGQGQGHKKAKGKGMGSKGWCFSFCYMKFLVWNVKGCNDSLKLNKIVKVVKKLNVEVLCLFETRVKENNASFIVQSKFSGWSFVNNYSDAINGRIWVLFKNDWQVDVISRSAQNLVLSAPSAVLITREKQITGELMELIKAEEKFLKQKSRIQFVNEGDQNSAYFFRKVKVHHNVNTIRTLQDRNGVRLESYEDISGEFVQFFFELLGSVDANVERIPDNLLRKILDAELTSDMQSSLVAPVTQKEIRDVFKEIMGVKRVAEDVFKSETETLGRIRHGNIMKLLMCCSGEEFRILVYEYMENGSLGDVLHGDKCAGLADWPKRFAVAIGAAQGLAYLHHDC